MVLDIVISIGSSSPIDRDLRLLACFPTGAKHSLGIEFHGDFSPRIDGDHAAFAAQGREFPEYHFPRRLADATSTEAHSRADIVRNDSAHEYLPVSGGRHRA